MPKYHFEINDGFRLEDPVGVDCSGDAQAKTVAKDIARQIASDTANESDFSADPDRKVVVVDGSGAEVYAARIKR